MAHSRESRTFFHIFQETSQQSHKTARKRVTLKTRKTVLLSKEPPQETKTCEDKTSLVSRTLPRVRKGGP